MKKIFLFLFLSIPVSTFSQSRAMCNISEKFEDAFTMVFYYSTLKMVIPEDNKELKELIYGIEKIKMLRIDDENGLLSNADIVNIKADLTRDNYEEGLSMRMGGKNTLAYIREKNGTMKGLFILISEEASLTIFDLIGEIPIDKLFTLTKEIEMLTENAIIIK
ncbi:MAG: DUF4252 domain-containing protein [Bacteroidetes bacterium]|nr:DUF4252 domain-containing protein [Bacteroidota bacterium]MCH8234414.1 DUF4252 domain-containing protein [Bacteroidota bacterium]